MKQINKQENLIKKTVIIFLLCLCVFFEMICSKIQYTWNSEKEVFCFICIHKLLFYSALFLCTVLFKCAREFLKETSNDNTEKKKWMKINIITKNNFVQYAWMWSRETIKTFFFLAECLFYFEKNCIYIYLI